jgi:multiple sugar transport system substrate-binding protein
MAYSWKRRAGLTAFALLSVVTLTGFGCRPQDPNADLGAGVTLVVWGLWQGSEEMAPIISSFEETYGVKIEYKKIASVADYERRLLQALAERRGPDVFVIHHTWVEGKRGLMSPAPPTVIDERALREEFVDVVAADVLRDGDIYALPASVDTLALYYNKDQLAAAGIARPPQTWDELQQVVERLTSVSRFGTIEQSAITLGTAGNINRAADILQLLMLQSGLSFVGEQGSISLSGDAGARALTFYTDFANKSKQVYTWDLQQDYSLDAFAEGETAMMINYSYQLPTIKAKNPRLNFAVAPMPQIADSKIINFAAYWPFAISRQTQVPDVAWRFVRYLSSAPVAAQLNATAGTPPARRDSIAPVARDPVLGVFAEQVLTAATWPRTDIVATDAIINTMIDSVVTGAAAPAESLRRAEGQLNQLKVAPVDETEESSGGSSPQGIEGIGFF